MGYYFEESGTVLVLEPGIGDVHTHPRAFDPRKPDNFLEINEGFEGKAGLEIFTIAAIKSGVTTFIAMPNESMRRMNLLLPEQTEAIWYPIANLDRAEAMGAAIIDRSVIPGGYHVGVDSKEVILPGKTPDDEILLVSKLHDFFEDVQDDALGLKLYLAKTTGGNDINIRYAPEVISIWHKYNPEKPITLHVEGPDVAKILDDIARLPNGDKIPIHIAHVSSREELQAVIDAKRQGMNVTCEVTPHHLFFDETQPDKIGGYGCMKPSLKTQDDIKFIWDNIEWVDMFASDCAPHRISDKEAASPIPGVTNHTTWLPLLLQAVKDEKLTYDQLYDKLCVKPRERFKLPVSDRSFCRVHLKRKYSASVHEKLIRPNYGHNIFVKANEQFDLLGQVIEAKAGKSHWNVNWADHEQKLATSYTHLLNPRNIKAMAEA